jgi:hypothetical protein
LFVIGGRLVYHTVDANHPVAHMLADLAIDNDFVARCVIGVRIFGIDPILKFGRQFEVTVTDEGGSDDQG